MRLEQRCETSNRYVLRSKVVRECVFKFICSRLEPGNAICGSYGIDVLSQPPQSDGNLSMSSPNLSMSSPCHHGLLVTRKVTRISSLCRLAFSLSAHCYIGCASHSELNIPQPLLSRAVKSNCLGLSGPDASAGRSGWCFVLPRMWGFHPYHFCLLHSAPWPSNMI